MGIALIVGAGFSCEAGLPSTKSLTKQFLTGIGGSRNYVDDAITAALTQFWRRVFGIDAKVPLPSLEDHFTVLDLAANTGHHLGRRYPPRRLRAIRRLSIHRTFQVLDMFYKHSAAIDALFRRLRRADPAFSIVSLNWDVVAEKHLTAIPGKYRYGVTVHEMDGLRLQAGKIRLYKMHGSSNWLYCDSCRRLYVASNAGKAALGLNAYLEPHDFEALGFPGIASTIRRHARLARECVACGNRLAGRVATFSYRKAFSINQFQTIWERAYSALCLADKWLFVGYSMPEADFEFRHLLKAAQLARRSKPPWLMEAVVKNDPAGEERYRRFFGNQVGSVWQKGLSTWVDTQMSGWLKK